ncbi:MAG: lipocalin-like domain-containing protein [Chloroflexi bacterium]|nr:lipocalin-like domain-containing protein [Chloroflexota bacterium]
MTSGGRSPASSSSEMATLFKSMAAYIGKWSIDGDKFVTKVDGACDPSWLSIRTAPIEHPAFPGQKIISYLDWQREA